MVEEKIPKMLILIGAIIGVIMGIIGLISLSWWSGLVVLILSIIVLLSVIKEIPYEWNNKIITLIMGIIILVIGFWGWGFIAGILILIGAILLFL